MSRRGEARAAARCIRISILAAAVGFGCLAQGADTPPPAPAPAAPAEDSIEAAKRDFEAIKAARNPAELPRGELPRLAMPDSPTLTPTIQPKQSARPEDAAKAKKSANWLVDAMEQARKEDGRTGRGTSQMSDETRTNRNELLGDGSAEKPQTPDLTAAAADRAGKGEERLADKPKPAPADNPLNRYMGSWMTPQDLALLRPVMDSATSQGTSAPTRAPTSAAAAAAIPADVTPVTLEAIAQLAPAKTALPATPVENPYLATFAPPPSAASQPVMAMPPPASPAPAAGIFAPPPPPATPPPIVPDFVKPQVDDKYYKPLKRF